MIEQLSVAYVIWPTIITSLAGLTVVAVKAYARHQLVKTSLKRVKQHHRAEVLRATALLLEERSRWRFGSGRGKPSAEGS